ncbi:MAG: NAD(+)/NADH kinase [Elusimicrobiota bacterium]
MKAVRAVLGRGKIKMTREPDSGVFGQALEADIAVAVGGDGTMLRAARVAAPFSIPLLGVNAGGLGFLAGMDAAELKRHGDDLIEGRFLVEERLALEVECRRAGRRIFGPMPAFNDAVVRCGDQARAVSVRLFSKGRFMADYFGDGIIVSTPGGSTAYALAASGPIVDPSLNVLLVAPICPHTLAQRPLVLPESSLLRLRIIQRGGHDAPRTLLSVDGQISHELRIGDEILVKKWDKPLRLLLPRKKSFYDILRRKLRWGER